MTGFKLFGVEINLGEKEESSSIRKERAKDESCMRKSKSMGNLQARNSQHNNNVAGYLSDGLIQNKSNTPCERKKGLPWTEDEHRSFLIGLKKMGKGDWKGISKKHVPTRTPTQVASHAQKYFIRVTATEKKKRRSSLFDIHFEEPTPLPQASPASPFDKASEISEQVSTDLVAPLKNIGEIQGKPSTSGLVAASEKPPLLLMAETYVPDFCLMPPYMIGVPPVGQSFPAAKFVPAVFFPAMNYPKPGHAYLPSSHGNFSTIQF